MSITPTFQPAGGRDWRAYNVANGGGAAGATVSVAVAIQDAVLPSGQYLVNLEVGQDVTWYISAKTASGFTVNLQPRLAANSVAAGTFNVQCTW